MNYKYKGAEEHKAHRGRPVGLARIGEASGALRNEPGSCSPDMSWPWGRKTQRGFGEAEKGTDGEGMSGVRRGSRDCSVGCCVQLSSSAFYVITLTPVSLAPTLVLTVRCADGQRHSTASWQEGKKPPICVRVVAHDIIGRLCCFSFFFPHRLTAESRIQLQRTCMRPNCSLCSSVLKHPGSYRADCVIREIEEIRGSIADGKSNVRLSFSAQAVVESTKFLTHICPIARNFTMPYVDKISYFGGGGGGLGFRIHHYCEKGTPQLQRPELAR
ncbi:hypothetical protein BS50DRAFT_33807 [Corynespora cassiicola Philippines]|uniref:Uncharacterized protein n=1 Tax=Corynespora cassiicola Philippines TaxID=1448308 RepID=A0A2T2PBY7_CORCC|nr:hypothetical protein BS50DRAFT_33807 [Corynespora cassiicola Philippines]